MDFDDGFIDDLLRSYEGNLYLPDPEDLGIFVDDISASCPPSPHLGATPSVDDVPDLVLDYPENNQSESVLLERIHSLEEEVERINRNVQTMLRWFDDLRPYLLQLSQIVQNMVRDSSA